MFPKFKKRLSSFLLDEGGEISKQALVSLGAFLGSGVLAGLLLSKGVQADHTNDLSVSYGSGVASGTHTHHSSDCDCDCGDDGDDDESESGDACGCSCGSCGSCSSCACGSCGCS